MDPYAPEGILPNLLRFVDRPGQVVRNVLRGNPGAALRQGADILGELIDAPLPGDWIPSATSRDDYVSGSELVGMDQTPGLGMTAVDIGVGIATDPLSYLSFGAIPLAKQAAMGGKYAMEFGLPFTGGAMRTPIAIADQAMDPLSLAMRGGDWAAKQVTGALDPLAASSKTIAGAQSTPITAGYEGAKAWVRRAAGADDIRNPVQKRLTASGSLGSASAKVWEKKVSEVFKGMPEDERTLLGQAFFGVDGGSLKASDIQMLTPMGDDMLANVAALARAHKKDPVRLQSAAQKMLDISKGEFDEGLAGGAFSIGSTGRPDYLQRKWTLSDKSRTALEGKPGSPSATTGRSLETSTDVADFFNANKDKAGLELDAAKLMMNRAQQQGTLMSRAKAAIDVGGKGTLATKDLQISALERVEKLAKRGAINADEAYRLKTAIEGLPPRTGILGALAGANRFVKGAMVYGVALPKVGSMVRNKLGMAFQAAATPGAREESMKQLASLPNDLFRAWDEAYGQVMFGKSLVAPDKVGQALKDIDAAFTVAKDGNDVANVLTKAGKKELAEMVEYGVLDGYVSTEELINKLARSPSKQKWKDIYDAPGVMFGALEQRGRAQLFLNLRAKRVPADKAAQMTKDALYDYGISSAENRAFRDIIPFGQFMAKAIPQQAKMLSQQPASAAALAPLFYDPSGEEGPIYPYMQGKSRVGMGEDSAGNPLYLSGFGLPVESLDMLPNFSADMRVAGRDVQSGLLSSTQPLLKTAAAFATGEDPYFGTAFGSYSKLPIVGEAGDAGRYINMALGTGIGEPFGAGIVRQIGQATDERKPIGARALDLVTGAKLTAVDPDIAQQRVISDYLETRPDVSQYRTFYKSEDDPEFSSLMSELRAAKQRAKANKEKAALAAP